MSSIFPMVFFTGLTLVFDGSILFAQYQNSKYEIGANLGTMVYQGDLTPGYAGNFKSLHPAIGFSGGRSLGRQLSLSVNLLFGKLEADESRYLDPSWRKDRSFSFNAFMTELSTSIVWNLNRSKEYRQPRFTPYIFAGVGLTVLSIRKDWSSVNSIAYDAESTVQAGLAIDTLKATGMVMPVIPFGLGLKYRVNSQFSINTAINYRLSATDYIDGFKYSGNAARKDSYYGVSIGILYNLGRYRCPPIK